MGRLIMEGVTPVKFMHLWLEAAAGICYLSMAVVHTFDSEDKHGAVKDLIVFSQLPEECWTLLFLTMHLN